MNKELAKNEYQMPSDKNRVLKAFSKDSYFEDFKSTVRKENTFFTGDRHDLIHHASEYYDMSVKDIQLAIQEVATKMGTDYGNLRWFIIYNPIGTK